MNTLFSLPVRDDDRILRVQTGHNGDATVAWDGAYLNEHYHGGAPETVRVSPSSQSTENRVDQAAFDGSIEFADKLANWTLLKGEYRIGTLLSKMADLLFCITKRNGEIRSQTVTSLRESR